MHKVIRATKVCFSRVLRLRSLFRFCGQVIMLCFLAVLFGFFGNCSSVFAYSLTVTSSESISINVKPAANGEVGTAVVADDVDIVSDCRAGYNFVITGPSDNNLYLNGDEDNNDSGTYFSQVDGINALNSLSNTNKWGYSLTANNKTGVFSALSSEGEVLKTTSQTASLESDIDDVVPIYYGVSLDNNLAPGSYTFANEGRISYRVVMDVSCIPGIHYEANGADEGEMEIQDVEAGEDAYLVAPNYSREGYGFASWNTRADGTGTNYGPNEYITMPDSGVLVLYANWVESSGNLQGWMGCSSLAVNDVIGLTDTRDGNVYAVAKLADGKCWMVENLRLDLGEVDITVYNTENPTAEFLERLDGVSANNGEWCTRTEPTPSPYADPCESEINFNTSNLDRSLEASYDVNKVADVSWYSYGVMYNNYTARAGNSSFGYDRGSICPIGWKLPTGETRLSGSLSQDYHALMYAWDSSYQASSYNANNGVDAKLAYAYPNNFIVSGVYSESTFNGRAVFSPEGFEPGDERPETAYWAVGSHMTGVGNSFTQYVNGGGIVMVSDGVLSSGHNVRCVVGDTIEDYTLNYNLNGGETTISSVTAAGNTVHEFTISSIVPQRTGYNFMWWMDKDGNTYDPGDTFIAIDTNSTLYAIWENTACNPNAETISEAVCLQDMNDEVKSTMVTKQTYALRDERDNKQYTISLLDDGVVWMTKNLDLGMDNVMVLTSGDTDINDDYYFLPARNNLFVSDNTKIQLGSNIQYGGYYSWPAAILSGLNYSSYSKVITTSICPSGWDLPLDSHYSALITSAGINGYSLASVSPYNFTLGGYLNSTGFVSVGTSGKYWTAITSSGNTYDSVEASLINSNFAINNFAVRTIGNSVRCIASNGVGTINYDANGGSGSMESRVNVEINATKIDRNTFVEPNSHKQFREWNTRADGTGIAVRAGDAVTKIKDDLVDGEVTLYAQWNDIYFVTFNNTDTSDSIVRKVVAGANTGTYIEWTRTDYTLGGWDTNPNAQTIVYSNSEYFTPTSDLSLYSVWIPRYYIVYDGNGADSGNMDNCYPDEPFVAGTQFGLQESDYVRAGYGFVGWSTNSAAVPGDGVSTIYGPNEIFTIPNTGQTGTITFYAVWVQADSNYTMQSFGTSGMCSTLSIGDVIGLSDTRDSNTYAVAKLVDGECWMLENLRLDPSQATITAQNTDAPTSDFLGKLSNYPSPYDGCDDNSDPDCVNSVGFDNGAWFSNGKRYNWYTATAGNGTYDVLDTEVAIGSICPNGWHLPRGTYWGDGVWGEYDELWSTMGGYSNWRGRLYPYDFLDSYYWTSGTSSYSGVVVFDGDSGFPLDYPKKTDYYYARCVADNTYTIEFSSEYSSGGSINDIQDVKIGDTIVLPDSGFTYDGFILVGWGLTDYGPSAYDIDDIYLAGSSIIMDRNLRAEAPTDRRLTLYPVLDVD